MKLKPCPFCGGEAQVIFDEEFEHWRIRCKNIDCDVRPSTSWFYVKEEAIEAWNRREPIDKIVEQLGKHSFEWDNAIDYIETLVAMDIVKKGG